MRATLGEAEWSDHLAALESRGLVEGGVLTTEGFEFKTSIETITDDLAETAFEVLTKEEQRALADALLPLTRAVIRAGEIPADSPMGLKLDQI